MMLGIRFDFKTNALRQPRRIAVIAILAALYLLIVRVDLSVAAPYGLSHQRIAPHRGKLPVNRTGLTPPPAWVINDHLQSRLHFLPMPIGGHWAGRRSPSNPGFGKNQHLGQRPLLKPCSEWCKAASLQNRYNGPVQTNPEIYIIFWGSNWDSYDTGIKAALERFYTGLTGTGWWQGWSGILTQYCAPNGCPALNGATFKPGHVWIDPDTARNVCDVNPLLSEPCPSNGNPVIGEVEKALNLPGSGWAGASENPNAQFIVIPSRGSSFAPGFDPAAETYARGEEPSPTERGFCAYHGSIGPATYTFLPDLGDPNSMFVPCRDYAAGSNATNAETSIASHEYAETVTDPHLHSWFGPYGEIGDTCVEGETNHAAETDDEYPGTGMWVQGQWDQHLSSCSLSDTSPPPVNPIDPPDGVSNLTPTSVTLNANVNPNGTQTDAYFEWGTTSAYGNMAPATPVYMGAGTESVLLAQPLTNLQPHTVYHFRSVVYNSWSGKLYGPDQTFKTPSPPVITNSSAYIQAPREVNLGGTINPEEANTHYHFEYDTRPYLKGEGGHGTSVPVPDQEIGPSGEPSVRRVVAGAFGKTTYYWRLVATNAWGTTYGEGQELTTPSWAPKAWAKPATEVVEGHAMLQAFIDTFGFDTHYRFEWGTTAAYGNTTAEADAGSGEELKLAQAITGIKPETTYHFRVIATSSEGTAISEDQTFMVHEWLVRGIHVTGAQPIGLSTPEPILFQEQNSGEEFRCTFTGQGAVLPAGKGEITSITSGSGGKSVTCPILSHGNGYCSGASVEMEAQNLPWDIELITENGEVGLQTTGSPGNGGPMWLIKCNEGSFKELCPAAATTSPSNSIEGVELTSNGVSDGRCQLESLTQRGSEKLYQREGQSLAATLPPLVATGTAIESNGAMRMNGHVDPDGFDTHYHFEYDTRKYEPGEAPHGWSAPVPSEDIRSAPVPLEESQYAGAIKPGTTYHFRIVGENAYGKVYGRDSSFTAPALTYNSSFSGHGSGSGQLSEPSDLAVDASGDLWVADTENNRLEEFGPTGSFLRTVGSRGSGNGQFEGNYGVTVDSKGNIWATDLGGNRVEEFTSTGEFIRTFGSKGNGNGQFYDPEGVTVDKEGHVYVADRGNSRIEELSETGTFIRSFSNPAEPGAPFDVERDAAGNIWVSYESYTPYVTKVDEFSASGTLLRTWGTTGTGVGQVSSVHRFTIGPEGDLWLCEWDTSRVQVFTPEGEYLYGFGTSGSGAGQFWHPRGLAFYGNNVFVLDSGFWQSSTNDRIEKWTR